MSKVGVNDRISGLPDSVLCHMLSFLPTKYAVSCRVLSTRWNNIWASVPNLDFENKNSSDSAGFMTFVERVLFLRDSSDIQRFRLHCSSVGDFTRIYSWVRTAIVRNVVELDLGVFQNGQTLELPKSLFMCKTLVVFKVKSNCITYKPPTSGCFPSLKFLHVIFERPDSESMEKLFSCCPVLEDLTIDVRSAYTQGWKLKISAPELKTLKIALHFSNIYTYCETFINAPKLENLDLEQDIPCSYYWENIKSIVKASVNLYSHDVSLDGNLISNATALIAGLSNGNLISNATALLAGISNVKYLSLSAHSLNASCLPTFDHLSELKLVLHDCYRWELLTDLLSRSPNLQSLIVEHKKDKVCAADDTFQYYLTHILYSEQQWSTPESVPICLISHLKTITVRGFKGYPHEKKAAMFLFENGKVLDKMTIDTGLCKDFSPSQSASRACQFELM